ncbi:hypothetical protein LY76DRAFT_143670 [Colletotrichum caudatum]|nr:hypothetical protein LY76DRAFT_143670 [Colletotrichum caudatum]
MNHHSRPISYTMQLCKIAHRRARMNGGKIGPLHKCGRGGLCSGPRSRNSTLHVLPDSHIRLRSQIAVFGRRARFPSSSLAVLAGRSVGGGYCRVCQSREKGGDLGLGSSYQQPNAAIDCLQQTASCQPGGRVLFPISPGDAAKTPKICYVRHGRLLSFSVGEARTARHDGNESINRA